MTRRQGGLYGLNERQLPPKPPSKWRWPVRIILFFSCIIGIGLFMLSRSGGSDEGLRQTVESMLGDISGYRADVKTLNGVSFYPILGLDIENTTLYDDQSMPVVTARNVNYSTGFWATVFGRAEFRTIGLRDVSILAGAYTPKALVIDTLSVIDYPERNDRALLDARGLYGGEAIYATISLKADLSKPYKPRFSFDSGFELRIGAGPLSLDMVTDTSARNSSTLTIKAMGDNRADRTIRSTLTMRPHKGKLEITGPLEIGQTDLALDLAYTYGETRLDGTVTGERIDQADLTGPGGIADIVRTAFTLYAGPEADIMLGALNADIVVKTDNFVGDNGLSGPRSFQLVIRNGVLKNNPLMPEGKPL